MPSANFAIPDEEVAGDVTRVAIDPDDPEYKSMRSSRVLVDASSEPG